MGVTADEQYADIRRHQLDLELAQLENGCRAAYWAEALAVNAHAAAAVMKMMITRCRIVGLARPNAVPEQKPMLVIGGTSEEYIAGSKAIDHATPPELAS
jgi:hypothetical protein